MESKTKLIFNCRSNTIESNINFYSLLKIIKKHTDTFDIFLSSKTDIKNQIENKLNKPIQFISMDKATPNDKLIFIEDNETDKQTFLEYLKSDYAILYKEQLSQIDIQDYVDGYLLQDSPEFYSKIFKEPVIVTDPSKVKMSLGATINPRAILLTNGFNGKGGRIDIGRASHIGADALFNLAGANFKIGAFCMISANASIHGARHSITHPSSFNLTKGPFKWFGEVFDESKDIEIGNDVWIGEGCTILPGVSIGDGAVVGAGSIVTKSIEPYSIHAGNPAKLIRKRFDDKIIELLLETKWWTWDYNKIKNNNDFFKSDISLYTYQELKDIFDKVNNK